MDFVKSNLFKKLQDEMPIGLTSLGLKRQKVKQPKKNILKDLTYPNFFALGRVMPAAI